MKNKAITIEELWIKKANAAKRRGSWRMMIPPDVTIKLLTELIEKKDKLNRLHERLGETNFSNMLK